MNSPNKRELTAPFVKHARANGDRFVVWDTHQAGLALRLHPGGSKVYVVVYQHAGRSRWYTLGSTNAIGLSDARANAANILARVSGAQREAINKRSA